MQRSRYMSEERAGRSAREDDEDPPSDLWRRREIVGDNLSSSGASVAEQDDQRVSRHFY
jgi:hypothetical protein